MSTKITITIIILIAVSLLLGGTVYYARYMGERNIEQTMTDIALNNVNDKENGEAMPLLNVDYQISEINGYELIKVDQEIKGDPINIGYSLVKYRSDEYEIVKNPYTGENEKFYKEFYLRFYPKDKDKSLYEWVSGTTSSVNCKDEIIGTNKYLVCEELGIVDGLIYYIEGSGGVYEFYLGILGLNEDTRKVLESFQIL